EAGAYGPLTFGIKKAMAGDRHTPLASGSEERRQPLRTRIVTPRPFEGFEDARRRRVARQAAPAVEHDERDGADAEAFGASVDLLHPFDVDIAVEIGAQSLCVESAITTDGDQFIVTRQ